MKSVSPIADPRARLALDGLFVPQMLPTGMPMPDVPFPALTRVVRLCTPREAVPPVVQSGRAIDAMEGHPSREQLVHDICRQHQHIFTLISRLGELAAGAADRQTLHDYIDDVLDCVQANFAAEEYVLTVIKDRRRGALRPVHQKVVDDLAALRDTLFEASAASATELAHSLDSLVVYYLNDDPFFPRSVG